MAQNSFPKGAAAEKPMTDQEWKLLMMALGDGIIDRGGYPYLLTNKDNATNQVTIQVDQSTGFNQSVVHGFVHVMDAAEQLVIPPVTSGAKTFHIGLVYDPTKHSATNGPVTLSVWEAPGDFTQGKARLVLYRVTRSANMLLTNATFADEKPRVSPSISVNKRSELPRSEMTRVDTLALIRDESALVRLDRGPGGLVWKDVAAKDPDVAAATWAETGDTIVRRGTEGAARIEDPPGKSLKEITNVGWVQEYVANSSPAASTGANPGLMARNAEGQTSVASPTAAPHATPKSYVDDRIGTRAPSRHEHDGTEIKKNGGAVPWEVITGSTSAYNTTSGGSTWASVAVSSGGRFFRYPSNLASKKNIRRWAIDPADAVAVTPIKYEDKESGDTRVGVPADSYLNTIPELVITDPETGEVQGWQYMLMPVLQQVAIRWHDERIKALETQLADLTARLEAIEQKGTKRG